MHLKPTPVCTQNEFLNYASVTACYNSVTTFQVGNGSGTVCCDSLLKQTALRCKSAADYALLLQLSAQFVATMLQHCNIVCNIVVITTVLQHSCVSTKFTASLLQLDCNSIAGDTACCNTLATVHSLLQHYCNSIATRLQ